MSKWATWMAAIALGTGCSRHPLEVEIRMVEHQISPDATFRTGWFTAGSVPILHTTPSLMDGMVARSYKTDWPAAVEAMPGPDGSVVRMRIPKTAWGPAGFRLETIQGQGLLVGLYEDRPVNTIAPWEMCAYGDHKVGCEHEGQERPQAHNRCSRACVVVPDAEGRAHLHTTRGAGTLSLHEDTRALTLVVDP